MDRPQIGLETCRRYESLSRVNIQAHLDTDGDGKLSRGEFVDEIYAMVTRKEDSEAARRILNESIQLVTRILKKRHVKTLQDTAHLIDVEATAKESERNRLLAIEQAAALLVRVQELEAELEAGQTHAQTANDARRVGAREKAKVANFLGFLGPRRRPRRVSTRRRNWRRSANGHRNRPGELAQNCSRRTRSSVTRTRPRRFLIPHDVCFCVFCVVFFSPFLSFRFLFPSLFRRVPFSGRATVASRSAREPRRAARRQELGQELGRGGFLFDATSVLGSFPVFPFPFLFLHLKKNRVPFSGQATAASCSAREPRG